MNDRGAVTEDEKNLKKDWKEYLQSKKDIRHPHPFQRMVSVRYAGEDDEVIDRAMRRIESAIESHRRLNVGCHQESDRFKEIIEIFNTFENGDVDISNV